MDREEDALAIEKHYLVDNFTKRLVYLQRRTVLLGNRKRIVLVDKNVVVYYHMDYFVSNNSAI